MQRCPRASDELGGACASHEVRERDLLDRTGKPTSLLALSMPPWTPAAMSWATPTPLASPASAASCVPAWYRARARPPPGVRGRELSDPAAREVPCGPPDASAGGRRLIISWQAGPYIQAGVAQVRHAGGGVRPGGSAIALGQETAESGHRSTAQVRARTRRWQRCGAGAARVWCCGGVRRWSGRGAGLRPRRRG